MADSNQNIEVTPNEWADLYDLSGITPGTAIAVENVGDCDVYLAVQATQPNPDHDAYVIVRRGGLPYRNSDGDSGAWAFCQGSEAKLSVRTVS